MYVNCEGIVLRKYRYSETSYILHMFTREFGRINALAKGARRKSSTMLGHFDLYNVEEITLFRRIKSDLDLATGANLLSESRVVRNSPLVFNCAGVLAEIVLKCCMLHDRHELAYDAFVCFLQRCEREDNKAVSHLITSLWLILRDLGFEPVTAQCQSCGVDAGGDGFVLSPAAGGLLCADCASGTGLGRLAAGDLAGMRYLAADRADTRVAFNNNLVLQVLMSYIEYILGMSCQSYRLLGSMLKISV